MRPLFPGVARTLRGTALLIGLLTTAVLPAQPARWKSLFDGKTLRGWWQYMEGKFTVENGAIVGRPGPRPWPGGLFTTTEWSDFELEFEWKVEGPAETGVWFRRTIPRISKGIPPKGCQADLNDGKRADGYLSGSLWCSGKDFVAVNRDPSSIVPDDWNRMRIIAVGDDITIEQNGKTVVRARDESAQSGLIGIQLPREEQHRGMAVYIRNIRIRAVSKRP